MKTQTDGEKTNSAKHNKQCNQAAGNCVWTHNSSKTRVGDEQAKWLSGEGALERNKEYHRKNSNHKQEPKWENLL